MKAIEKIMKWKRLHEMISKGCTGTPDECAQKLHISKRTLFNYIGYFRDLGAGISYNTHERSYLYEKNCIFIEQLFVVFDETEN